MKKNMWMVTSSGIKDGQPYAFLKQVREGKSKNAGEPYANIDEKSFKKEDEALPLGKIVSYKEERITDDWPNPPEAKK